MDFKNAPKKRTTNFREDETRLLIQLWGSPTVQNKLYLTHRKAPVMRLIAANMQKHGFYRTPDEIKTRIRNLKCLYHRIKKSVNNGVGIGTVDPDWPHYKTMDEILSKRNTIRQNLVYNHNLLSEVNAEVKMEIEDIDINDDAESFTSNSNGSDDEFEETHLLPATITPMITDEEKSTNPVKIAPKPEKKSIAATLLSASSPSPIPSTSTTTVSYPRIQIAQNLLSTPNPTALASPKLITNTIQTNVPTNRPVNISTITPKIQTTTVTANTVNKSNNAPMPFPLLILNGMNGVQSVQNGTAGLLQKSVPTNLGVNGTGFNAEISSILKEMLDIQKENLEVEKERLEVEKQKLELERAVGSQLLGMAPMFYDMFNKFKQPVEEVDTKNFVGHPNYNQRVSKSMKRSSDNSQSPLNVSKKPTYCEVNDTKHVEHENGTSNSDTDADSGIANDSL